MINIIACVGKNNELGKDNNLIFHIPNDMKFFRKTTSGHTIVMGSKTFESLGGLLPNRKHIVLSSKNDFPKEVDVFNNFDDLLKYINIVNEDVFIIGGGKIYNLFVNYADNIYLTEVDKEIDADTYFPKFDKNNYEASILEDGNYEGLNYKICLYKKMK